MTPPLLDARWLLPPLAPEQNHEVLLPSLPGVPAGAPETRLSRARTYLASAREQVFAAHQRGDSGVSVCRLQTEITDRLVVALWEELAREIETPPGLCLAALGGYGRQELAPWSDVDLLLLRGPEVPRGQDATVRRFAAAFNTLLWDLKLVVGWSVRTAEECARAAEDDHTVRTALLDCRQLAGSEHAYAHLTRKVLQELLTKRAELFIQDKTAELKARREKYGDTVFLLEPHLKAGEGGLRDLEAALWIAQARFRTRGLSGLLRQSVLPASEVNVLRTAQDFLLRVRNHLHYLRGRKEDRLTFDLQEAVAKAMGYAEGPDALPVERFMRDYYLSAQVIRKAADALIARCEEGVRPRRFFERARPVGEFKVFRGKLTLEGDPKVLTRSPATAVRMFRAADEQGVPLYSWARDQLAQALPALEAARAEPDVCRELLGLFGRPGTRGQFLFEMHELGVLGALLPEFGRVTAHHQHDLYHVYTVDIHSLFAVRRLYALRNGELDRFEPPIARQMRELADPIPVLLATLLHDAGKGLGGDHSRKGQELMASVGTRLGLSAHQREVAEQLVLNHLLMSRTSQRRDLSDPDLIAEFCRTIRNEETLTALYLLTYADISSVGPDIWTDWKRRLLNELYEKARASLLGTGPADAAGLIQTSREAFEARWTAVFGLERSQRLAGSLPARYFLATPARYALRHARLLERAGRIPLASRLTQRPEEQVSELTLAARDRPGLLALFAGVLSAHRVSILGARITSSSDGLALDVFEVRGPRGGLLDRRRWKAARADLLAALAGKVPVEELLARNQPTQLLGRHLPKVATRVSVDNEASSRFSVVDVRAEDRNGVLHAMASALWAEGAQIALAKIATEANRAVNAFYVSVDGQKVPAERAGAFAERLQSAIDGALVGSR